MATADQQQTAWDSRDKFTTELMYRVSLVLSSSPKDLEQWYENLSDYFDLCSCVLEDRDKYLVELGEIDKLIHATKINGHVLNDQARRLRKEESYRRMRKLFREIHADVWKAGLYIPFKEVYDEVEGFASQFK